MNQKAINRINVVLVESNTSSKQLGSNEVTVTLLDSNYVQHPLAELPKVAELVYVRLEIY